MDPGRNSLSQWCSETDSWVLLLRDLVLSFLSFKTLFYLVLSLTLSPCVCYIQTGNLEDIVLSCRSKAIDRHLELLDRYRQLPPLSSRAAYPSYLPDLHFSSPSLPEQDPVSPSSERLFNKPLSPLASSMGTLIKINSFNGGNTEICEDVDEYLDDVETAAISWDLTITPGVVEASNKSQIRLFRQNLERDGDAWHWWYYVLSEADKKDFKKIAAEFRNRYGVKAAQASSLFAMQNEMLSLMQGEKEHIREYVHRVEKLSRKIPKDMDSLFAIAFIKGMRDQERRQRVTFDLKDTPNFSFFKALTVVKFSFQEIGEPDPFHPNQKVREPEQPPTLLYSNPIIPQVNSVAVTDIPHTALANSVSSPIITQEQFNAFMSSYEATMRRNSRFPYSQHPTSLASRRTNPRVTCFNCGTKGHYADMCANPPVSTYEQQEIRERLRREREQLTNSYPLVQPRLEPPLSGSNTITITLRAILQRPTLDKPSGSEFPAAPVTCVRSCKVSERDLGQACMIAARIPAVRTIFQNALAEKRARVEEPEGAGPSTQRAAKTPRRVVDMGESSLLRRSHRQTNNPLAHERGAELEPVVEIEVVESSSQQAEPDLVEVMDIVDRSQSRETGSSVQRTSTINKGKDKAEAIPINWMKGQLPFTIQDALSGPSPGLNITLPQLLDCSPRLRRDLAELLRSSVPRVRKKRLLETDLMEQQVALHSAKLTIGSEVVSEASPGNDDNIECLYIEAWVGEYLIPEVLVDAGAMLDLISSQLVAKLKLKRFPVTGLGMRLADDRLVILRNYVWIDVVVAGVLARIKAYEVAVSQTYQLLLSRRWLRRVRAVEYHDTQMLFIEGGDRVRRKVPGIAVGQAGVKMESLEPPVEIDVENEEAEEAIETLLNELDHWKDGNEGERISEN